MTTVRLNEGQFLGNLGADNADQGTISRLANAITEFRASYEKLADVRYGAAIARTHDNQLMHDYGAALAKAERMKDRIEAVTGAWDNIKQWTGLAAFPLIPIAIAAGLLLAVIGAIATINNFIRHADIRLAIQQDPELTYDEAAEQVDRESQSDFGKALDVAQLGFWAIGAFILYKIFSR